MEREPKQQGGNEGAEWWKVGDTKKFMGDDSSYKKSEVTLIIMDITHMDMRPFLEWFIYPVSLCWRKQIFPLPAGVSDSLLLTCTVVARFSFIYSSIHFLKK